MAFRAFLLGRTIPGIMEPNMTVSGRLMGPAAVWFTTWASQEIEITWVSFRDTVKSCYSKTFLPIVVGNPLLASKQMDSIPEYLTTWQQALATAPEAMTDRNTMLLTLIVNGLKPHICKWVLVVAAPPSMIVTEPLWRPITRLQWVSAVPMTHHPNLFSHLAVLTTK
ncbi:hypothetical protein DSO57_1013237 [Entomophthora muscae]|uniref:Uncharacterized protein n=1 Tax=Entomophthora muscae TaxID=34485 RepID=A0ACC2SJ50_9FUNG|nr:hypothetical protein DSO57_1013237 [Entomophthora muscae]